MEQSSPHLIRKNRRAFTLVELLIALALVSVVMGLAWIVLDSTRKVAEEINTPVENSLEPLWNQMQTELDRLLPSPVQSEIPGLRYSEDSGLELVSLVTGPEGIPLQTDLHYLIEDSSLVKVIRRPYPPLSQTNQIAENVTSLRIRGYSESTESEAWPTEPESPLPSRLSVDLHFANGENFSRDFYLPASFRYKKPVLDETTP